MRPVVFGVLVGAGLVAMATGTLGQPVELMAQRAATPQSSAAGSEWLAFSSAAGDKGQLITVVDPRQQAVAVYHVDLVSGKIALRSVRNIRWDLQVSHWNNENPLPQEIRALVEQR